MKSFLSTRSTCLIKSSESTITCLRFLVLVHWLHRTAKLWFIEFLLRLCLWRKFSIIGCLPINKDQHFLLLLSGVELVSCLVWRYCHSGRIESRFPYLRVVRQWVIIVLWQHLSLLVVLISRLTLFQSIFEKISSICIIRKIYRRSINFLTYIWILHSRIFLFRIELLHAIIGIILGICGCFFVVFSHKIG